MYCTVQNRDRQPGVMLFAKSISILFNPLVLVLPLFYVLALESPDTTKKLAIAILFFSLVPLLVLVLFKALRRIETLEIRNQHNRHLPFLFGITSFMAGYLVLIYLYGAIGIVQAAGFALAGSSAIAALINVRWKISIHCTAVAMTSVFLLHVGGASISGPLFITSVALAILICAGMMWSRVIQGAHSLPQTIAGILFGLLYGLTILSIYPI